MFQVTIPETKPLCRFGVSLEFTGQGLYSEWNNLRISHLVLVDSLPEILRQGSKSPVCSNLYPFSRFA